LGNEVGPEAVSQADRLADRIAVNFDNEYDDDRDGYWSASSVGGVARFEFTPLAGPAEHVFASDREIYEVTVTRVDLKGDE
jgi:hypothetical protein